MYYIYCADTYCVDCGEAFREAITAEGHAPVEPDDEHSYDSDEFPKGPYEPCESDTPNHCGCHDDCLNAHEFPDGSKIGAWLENELTTEGVEYVKEAIREGGEVAELWADYYQDYDLDDPGEEEEDYWDLFDCVAAGYHHQTSDDDGHCTKCECQEDVEDWTIEQCQQFLDSHLGIDCNTIELDSDGVQGWRNYVAARLDDQDDARKRRANELFDAYPFPQAVEVAHGWTSHTWDAHPFQHLASDRREVISRTISMGDGRQACFTVFFHNQSETTTFRYP